jgi:hypothetical protein
VPRLIFNAKTLKLCSKIKSRPKPNKPRRHRVDASLHHFTSRRSVARPARSALHILLGGGSLSEGATSGMGQSRHFDRRPTTSGLPSGTDIPRAGRHVSNVPNSDMTLTNHAAASGPARTAYPARRKMCAIAVSVPPCSASVSVAQASGCG